MVSPFLPYGLAMSATSPATAPLATRGVRPVQAQCYASIEALRKIITQAEKEHYKGSLGIVRFFLKDEGNGNFDIDIKNTPERILVA